MTDLKHVHPDIIKRTENELGHIIPEKFTLDGKDFRKYLAKQIGDGADVQSEKLASEFLNKICVEFITWFFNWKNPQIRFCKLLLISYFCIMESEKPKEEYIRTVYKTTEYKEFYNNLDDKTKIKFDYVENIISTIYNVPTKFVKHLENSDLYEMRVSVGSNEYRTIIFAIDHQNFIEAKNIILLNSFLKKDNKDYHKQVEIAEKLLNSLEL